MANNFIVKQRKEDVYATVTLRMSKELLEKFDKLAAQSDRSRNEVMCMALQYAMDHLEFVSEPDEGTEPQ